jgi:hypothetical protein
MASTASSFNKEMSNATPVGVALGIRRIQHPVAAGNFHRAIEDCAAVLLDPLDRGFGRCLGALFGRRRLNDLEGGALRVLHHLLSRNRCDEGSSRNRAAINQSVTVDRRVCITFSQTARLRSNVSLKTAVYAESRRPEPARLLVVLIKAMQSTDPGIGPDDVAQGWRPDQNVNPTIMVSAAWAPMFQPLSVDAKRAITESFLAGWLEKNLQYPIGRYFRVGLSENSYPLPASYGSIAGGEVWEAAPLFVAAEVDPGAVESAARGLVTPGLRSRSALGRRVYRRTGPDEPRCRASGTSRSSSIESVRA